MEQMLQITFKYLLDILAYLLRSIHMLQLGDTFANAILWHENLSSRCAVFYVPPTEGRGDTYCFCCRSRRRPRSFMSVRYLLDQWLDFDQNCIDTLSGWVVTWFLLGYTVRMFEYTVRTF